MTVNQIAAWGSAAVVTVAIAVGLWLSGSPETQRLQALDEVREADLRQLVRAITMYHKTQGQLPETVAEVVDGVRLSSVPTDPASGGSYEYRRLTPQTYEVCANFATSSRQQDAEDFWAHGPGHNCYTFDTPPENAEESPD